MDSIIPSFDVSIDRSDYDQTSLIWLFIWLFISIHLMFDVQILVSYDFSYHLFMFDIIFHITFHIISISVFIWSFISNNRSFGILMDQTTDDLLFVIWSINSFDIIFDIIFYSKQLILISNSISFLILLFDLSIDTPFLDFDHQFLIGG